MKINIDDSKTKMHVQLYRNQEHAMQMALAVCKVGGAKKKNGHML